MNLGDLSKMPDAYAGELSSIIILLSIVPLIYEFLSKFIDKEKWAKAFGSYICSEVEKHCYYLPLFSIVSWLIFGLLFSLLKIDGFLIYTWIYFLLSGIQYLFFAVKAKKKFTDKDTKCEVAANNTLGSVFLFIFLIECIIVSMIYLR